MFNHRPSYRYVLLNKPYGYLSQFTTQDKNQLTLSSFNLPPHLYAAGRLDQDSEGLLLLTDDGPIIQRLLHPQNRHPRTYYVQVEGNVTQLALQQLQVGVTIKSYQTLPAKAFFIKPDPPLFAPRNPPIRVRKNIPDSWLGMTLVEGKNRQVRRMTAAVGLPTLRLVRVSIMNLNLLNQSGEMILQPGEWMEIENPFTAKKI